MFNLCRVGDWVHSTRQRLFLEDAIWLIEDLEKYYNEDVITEKLESIQDAFAAAWIENMNIEPMR